MIGKFSVLGFALATAVSGQALAHDPHDSRHRPPHHGHGPTTPYGYGPATPYGPAGYSARIETGVRHADLDRNGWVTLDEALTHGRFEFRRNDRNRDRVLSRHEVAWEHGHRGPQGRRGGHVTFFEYQDAVRAQFARLDLNRDGVLAHYELRRDGPRPPRSAGWWSHR